MEEKRIEESRIVNRNKRQKRRQCVAEWMEESSGEDRERKRGESAFPGEQTTRPIVVDEDSKGSTHDPSFLPSFLPPTFPLSLARFQSSTEIPPLPAIVVHSRVNSPLSLSFFLHDHFYRSTKPSIHHRVIVIDRDSRMLFSIRMHRSLSRERERRKKEKEKRKGEEGKAETGKRSGRPKIRSGVGERRGRDRRNRQIDR